MLIVRPAVSLLALACAVHSGPIRAQQAADCTIDCDAGEAPGISEFLVTSARDGAADIGKYSGSATVFDADDLEVRSFRDLSTLSYAAPNVSLDPIGTFRGVSNFAIRGLGVNSSIPSIEPAVGTFVDGVYQGVNAGTVFDMLDVERVEILRGPQGASFGRNTTGGAVMVTTADPSERWTGHARTSLEGPVDGGRGGWRKAAQGVVSGPVTNEVSFRVGMLRSDDPGYFRNLADGDDFGAMTTTALRGGLAWRSGGLEVIGKLDWTDSRGDGAAAHSNALFARDTFEMSVNQRGFYRSETLLGTLRATAHVGGGTLTNLFGWRDYDLSTRNDIDSTPDPVFQSDTATAQRQWSNELTYSRQGDTWGVVTGVAVFDQDVGYDESRDLSFFGAAPQFGGGRQEQRSVSAFALGRLEFAPSMTLEAGLNWSTERKSGAITYVRPRGACSAIEATCAVSGERVAGENNGFTDRQRWNALSPRVALEFAPVDQAMVYASWARGHRSGGYNLRITQPAAFEQVSARLGSPAFGQERVDTFELGGNWRSPDRRYSLRGAAFRSVVRDLQREVNVPSTSSGLAQSIYNTADARIDGLELEASARPAGGLEVDLNVGLIDADYTAMFFDLTGDGAIDAADLALELPRAPRWSLGGHIGYERSVGPSNTVRADMFFQHRGRFAYTDNNWGWNGAADRLDASVTYTFGQSGVTAQVYGRNLLDEVQFGGDTQLGFAAGPYSDGNNRPFDPRPGAGTFSPLLDGRSFGAELAYKF